MEQEQTPTTVVKGRIRALTVYLDEGMSAWPSVSIVVKDNGFWTGTIAYEDKETENGRVIPDKGLKWEEGPLPFLVRNGTDHDSLTDTRGVVHEVTRQLYGAIRANGTCDLPPGDYPCGLDLDNVTIETQ